MVYPLFSNNPIFPVQRCVTNHLSMVFRALMVFALFFLPSWRGLLAEDYQFSRNSQNEWTRVLNPAHWNGNSPPAGGLSASDNVEFMTAGGILRMDGSEFSPDAGNRATITRRVNHVTVSATTGIVGFSSYNYWDGTLVIGGDLRLSEAGSTFRLYNINNLSTLAVEIEGDAEVGAGAALHLGVVPSTGSGSSSANALKSITVKGETRVTGTLINSGANEVGRAAIDLGDLTVDGTLLASAGGADATSGVYEITARSLSGSGSFYGSSMTQGGTRHATLVLTTTEESNGIFSGVLADSSIASTGTNRLALKITGEGRQTLSGNHSYSGRTLLQNGATLLVNGTHLQSGNAEGGSLATDGIYRVEAGATLGGSGRIAGSSTESATNLVLIETGGRLAPGDGLGTLVLDGGLISGSGAKVLNMAAGTVLELQLAGDGTGGDRLSFWNYAAGDLLLNDTAVTLSLEGAIVAGSYSVVVLDFFSDAGTTVALSGISSGLTLNLAKMDARIEEATLVYDASGVRIDYTVVPEPSIVALAGLAGLLAFLMRGRRQGSWMAVFLMAAGGVGHAKEIVLAEKGTSNYQIIVPDHSPVEASLAQVARMMQTAFAANGVEIPVVKESARDEERPGIFLGSTVFAREAGVKSDQFHGWGYLFKTVGPSLVIAGHDHAPPRPGRQLEGVRQYRQFERLGTAKGVADFLREHLGVRFLYPDLPPEAPMSELAKVDLLHTPAITYLPKERVAIPAALERKVTPLIESDIAGGSWSFTGFYHLSQNRFPLVGTIRRVHTWHHAIPVAQYGKSHPEYFALINGKRTNDVDPGKAQYCISNPEVRELIYQDLVEWFKLGYENVDLGQPDGFRPCTCKPCHALYDTGDDWGEKIWRLHRDLAQRAYEAYPDRTVTIMSYILTKSPPKSFKVFPPNVQILLTGILPHEDEVWREIKAPRGISGYLYFWTQNLTTRYTPMQTPGSVAAAVRYFAERQVLSLYRDGNGGIIYGLEGPVYYTMGRMFDAPEELTAPMLVDEFVEAAFGKAAPAMKQFYSDLYDSVEIFARFLGTRQPAWIYRDENGRGRKFVRDPFRMLEFLYPPDLISGLEGHLQVARGKIDGEKEKLRFELVEREFSYLKTLMEPIYLHTAWQSNPLPSLLEPLLSALDRRNALLASWYEADGRRSKPLKGWGFPMFPPQNYYLSHLQLQNDSYQNSFSDTFLNWNTAAMRAQAEGGARRAEATIRRTTQPLTLQSSQWKKVTNSIMPPLPGNGARATTTLAWLAGEEHLYLRVEAQLPQGASGERVELHLAPKGGNGLSYRFVVYPDRKQSRTEAARGLIEDALDPRYGHYDEDWSRPWNATSELTQREKKWSVLLAIPWSSVGEDVPEPGSFWQANVLRYHRNAQGGETVSAWSQVASEMSADSAQGFGRLLFE